MRGFMLINMLSARPVIIDEDIESKTDAAEVYELKTYLTIDPSPW